MNAREELETWLRKWDAGHAVALPPLLDKVEREAEARGRRQAAEHVRGIRVAREVKGDAVPALLADHINSLPDLS